VRDIERWGWYGQVSDAAVEEEPSHPIEVLLKDRHGYLSRVELDRREDGERSACGVSDSDDDAFSGLCAGSEGVVIGVDGETISSARKHPGDNGSCSDENVNFKPGGRSDNTELHNASSWGKLKLVSNDDIIID
jgi:hypothetical protein